MVYARKHKPISCMYAEQISCSVASSTSPKLLVCEDDDSNLTFWLCRAVQSDLVTLSLVVDLESKVVCGFSIDYFVVSFIVLKLALKLMDNMFLSSPSLLLIWTIACSTLKTDD